ncbi:DUF6207 family protein [Streptomyces sp. NPDC058239]|uniref:DUF6207 family protein n=1 Tax=Streptomyces sp. NPDC058239 TaxID=3346395 RepID=UPI0036E5E70C
MRSFDAVYVSEPGLVVVGVAAGDEETALVAVAELGERWATSGPSEVWRVRTFADVWCSAVQGQPSGVVSLLAYLLAMANTICGWCGRLTHMTLVGEALLHPLEGESRDCKGPWVKARA